MTIYRELANGRLEYWTYCNCQRIYLTIAAAMREIERGAKVVKLT